jgi:sugar lactone lactonase YvrE
MHRPLLRFAAVFAALVIALSADRPAEAAAARSWSASTAKELSRGTLEGTAIDEEGRVRLAFGLETVWGPAEGVVWEVLAAGSDHVFVALSSPGRALRVGADGETELWFETSNDDLVAAVLPDQAGGVYIGLSPSGQVLHAREPGAADVLGDSGARFIWSMAGSRDGALWLATGIPGALMRMTTGGETETVYESGSDPVRCVVALDDGGAIIGTGGQGRVIRFDAAFRPFVVFDADEPEIVDIEIGNDGTLFVLAAQGSKQVRAARKAAAKAGEADETVRVTASAPRRRSSDNGETSDDDKPARPPTPTRGPSVPQGAVLYRLTEEAGAQKVWSMPNLMPYALARTADGMLLVATGDLGRIYRLDERGRVSMILEVPSDQASALAPSPDGTVWIGATSDARVERLGPGALEVGSYLTPAVDAGAVAEWGRLSWGAELPRGTGLRLFARSGNTDEPDATWTDWVELEGDGAVGVETPVPATRWFQARAELTASKSGESPLLRHLELYFQPRNRAPTIESFSVQAAGIVWSRPQTQAARPKGPIVASDPISREAVAGLQGRTPKGVRKTFELGARTASWKAVDPDGDTLTYSVEIRREGTAAWLPLEDGIDTDYVGWDARGLPDGLYRLRLTADDSKDNPEGKEFADRRTSSLFQIDNTRPSIEQARIRESGNGYDVEFVASDPGGNVAAVEIAVDAGEWRPLEPLDGVADSAEERYRTRIEGTDAGPPRRAIQVRVTDSSGNLGGDAWALDGD